MTLYFTGGEVEREKNEAPEDQKRQQYICQRQRLKCRA